MVRECERVLKRSGKKLLLFAALEKATVRGNRFDHAELDGDARSDDSRGKRVGISSRRVAQYPAFQSEGCVRSELVGQNGKDFWKASLCGISWATTVQVGRPKSDQTHSGSCTPPQFDKDLNATDFEHERARNYAIGARSAKIKLTLSKPKMTHCPTYGLLPLISQMPVRFAFTLRS